MVVEVQQINITYLDIPFLRLRKDLYIMRSEFLLSRFPRVET